MTALEVLNQNDGEVTKAYYADMNRIGPAGELAVALFRAQKRSMAAKRYRGGKYRRAAYEVKNFSLGEIVRILTAHPGLVERWGWKEDPKQAVHNQVLYVDLPEGQCSFHSEDRLAGPDYPGDWDGKRESAERICRYCDKVAVDSATFPQEEPEPAKPAPVAKPEKQTRYEREIARGGGRLAL